MILPPQTAPLPPVLRGCFFALILMMSGCMGYMQDRWSQSVIWYHDMNLRVANLDPDNPAVSVTKAEVLKNDIEKCDFYLDQMRNAWSRNDVFAFGEARTLFEGWKTQYIRDFAGAHRPPEVEVDSGD